MAGRLVFLADESELWMWHNGWQIRKVNFHPKSNVLHLLQSVHSQMFLVCKCVMQLIIITVTI